MAGNAQNKLNELFVDIGIGGLGKTLKGLNSISASFLLAKNAATQLVKPIVNMTHQFGQNAIGLEKMKLSFGTTIDQVQRLQAALKINSVQDLEKDIQSIYQTLSDRRIKGLSENFAAGLSMLGLNAENYNSDLEGTLGLLSDISDALSEMGADEANMIARILGVNYADLMFARGQRVNLRDLPDFANKLTQEEINKQIKGETSLLDLQKKVYDSMAKIFVDNQGPILEFVRKLGKGVAAVPKAINTIGAHGKDYAIGAGTGAVVGLASKGVAKEVTKQVIKKMGTKTLLKTAAKVAGGAVSQALPGLGTALGIAAIASTAGDIAEIKKIYDDVKTPSLEYIPELDELGRSNLSNNTVINVSQQINTADPILAGRESAQGIQAINNRAEANRLNY